MECTKLNSVSCESIWCKIFTEKDNYVTVGVCYRSPDTDEIETNNLFQCIKAAADDNHPVLIMGDVNYPVINWTMLTAYKSTNFFRISFGLLPGKACSLTNQNRQCLGLSTN